MAEILSRIDQVEVTRIYRVIDILEEIARAIENELTPQLRILKKHWKNHVLWSQLTIFGTLFVTLLLISIWSGSWHGLSFEPVWLATVQSSKWLTGFCLAAVTSLVGYIHFSIRRVTANRIKKSLLGDDTQNERRFWLAQAFEKNSRAWRPFMFTNPAGWSIFTRRRLQRILAEADRLVQSLNNRLRVLRARF
jgi:hypothetical protein